MAPRGKDREANRFSARAKRYAKVGTNVGGVAARVATARAARPHPKSQSQRA